MHEACRDGDMFRCRMFRCGTTDTVPVHYHDHVEKPGQYNTNHIDLLKKAESIKLENFAIA